MLIQDVASLTCRGRPSLIQGSGVSTMQMLDNPDIDFSYSAIVEARQSGPTCTASASCTVSTLKHFLSLFQKIYHFHVISHCTVGLVI